VFFFYSPLKKAIITAVKEEKNMKFNKLFDHTLLKQEATSQEIVKLCGEAKEYDFMSALVLGF
jgi:deoxyribose-phosphate aldolase